MNHHRNGGKVRIFYVKETIDPHPRVPVSWMTRLIDETWNDLELVNGTDPGIEVRRTRASLKRSTSTVAEKNMREMARSICDSHLCVGCSEQPCVRINMAGEGEKIEEARTSSIERRPLAFSHNPRRT